MINLQNDSLSLIYSKGDENEMSTNGEENILEY